MDRVNQTRAGYEDETRWMKFLVDAYTGGGGFQGRMREAPSGFWGMVSKEYDDVLSLLNRGDKLVDGSYLDRHHREEPAKFKRRIDVSHYLNYVKPTTDLKINYLARKPHRRLNVPAELEDWIVRTGYDKDFRRRALVTAVLGWFPMLVDLPQKEAGQTLAQQGPRDPYASMYLPVQMLDYELDEYGAFLWAKLATRFTRRPTWDADGETVTRTTIWSRTDFVVYESTNGVAAAVVDSGTHPFQAVPIVSWRSTIGIEDPVKADSVNRDTANEGRRLFNVVNELDEHLRGQVFALLVYPAASPTPTDSVVVGNENGLQISAEQKNVPFYLAPPSSIADTYEARIEASVIEIYRMARVEYDRASGTEASAQSKQQNFEQTNVAVVDLARSVAQADRDTLILVGRGLGIAEQALQAIECVSYDSYASEDLSLELEQATAALTIKELGPQVRIELLRRLAQQLLPQLTPDVTAVIDEEIEAGVAQATRDAEMAAEAAEAAAQRVEGEEGVPEDEQPVDDEEEPVPPEQAA